MIISVVLLLFMAGLKLNLIKRMKGKIPYLNEELQLWLSLLEGVSECCHMTCHMTEVT